jgi:flagellar biosynthesis/type III secretory pathway chaperone
MLQQLETKSTAPSEEQITALRAMLEKLSRVLTDENQLLESGANGDHSNFITAKNQILKELMMTHKSVSITLLPPAVLGELQAARKLVDRNQKLLSLQVKALNDVTDFLTKTAISEQGDGTYSREHQ